MLVDRDGVQLFCERRGQGAPPIVFIHGGLGDHTHFAPQLAHFAPAHEVLALDLRGHGQSAVPAPPYCIESFADDVMFLCDRAALERPVLVGHSLGGVVALDVAARYPQRVRAIAALEAPVVPPAEHAERSAELLEMLRGPDYESVVQAWAGRMVLGTTAHAHAIVARMMATPQHVVVSAVEHMLGYDSAAAAAACRVPFLCVGGAVDRARLASLCPQVLFGEITGGSHFLQLDCAGPVNELIERFVRELR